MENWKMFLFILGGVTTVIVSSRLIYLKVIRPIWGWLKKWETIYKEFIPDHGKSMKDQMNLIEANIIFIKSMQDALLKFDEYAVFLCNGGGYCVQVNKSYTVMFGIDILEAKGQGWLETVHIEDRERVHDTFVAGMAANSELNIRYKAVNLKTNETFNVEAVCVINRNSKQEVISIVGKIIRLQDTAQMKAEIKSTS